MKKPKKITVAEYITHQIAASDVAQKDIAAALGYEKPNVITMIKQGKCKLPLNKVGPLAKVLNVDPVHLLRMVMAEYMPDTWQSIQDLVGQSLVSKNELAIIEIIRESCRDVDLSLGQPAHRAAFIKAVEQIGLAQGRLDVRSRFIPSTRKKP